MRFIHATDRRNKRGIDRGGLRADMSSGRLAAVWLVSPSMTEYAILHCANKRRVRIRDIVLCEVSIPRRWVRRFSTPGLFYTTRDIPPERIRWVGRVKVVPC